MNKIFLFVFLLGFDVYAAQLNNMVCTEKSLNGHNYNYPERNISVTYKISANIGGQIVRLFKLRYLDRNSSFDITDIYYSRNTAYWVSEKSYDSQYFNSQCGSHINDQADYHFLVAGGDAGPMMCLSCNGR